MNSAAIAGAVIGGLTLIGTLLWYNRRKRTGRRKVAPSAKFMGLRGHHAPVLFTRQSPPAPVHDTPNEDTSDVSDVSLPFYTPRLYTDDMYEEMHGVRDYKDTQGADEVEVKSLGDEAAIDGASQRSASDSWGSHPECIGVGIAV